MKKYLLFLGVILGVSSARSQSASATMLNLDNAVMASGSSSSDQSYMATLSSGDNLVATHIYDGITGYINIRQVHSDGSVSTIKNFPTDDPLLGITCSSTGNFTCFYGQSNELGIIKFSSTGSVLWQKSISIGEPISPYYGSNHSIIETPSGNYYLTISNYSFTGLIKIDAAGNLAWSKKMTGPRDSGKCPGFCSTVTQSEGCITTLKDENYETLINMDANGNKVWSKSFGDALYRWTRSIKADNLGNFYVMGTYGNNGATYIQKLDANGNLIYGKDISASTTYLDAYVTASNDFYLLTESPVLQLTKIGASGDVLWSRGIGAVASSPATMYFSYFTSTPRLATLNFMGFMNDSTDLVFSAGSPSEFCNAYNYAVPNTADDAQIFDASVDTSAKINPLVVTVANTGLATTTTPYYISGDFCSYIASVNEHAAGEALNVYPNPATDHITVMLDNIKNSADAVVNMYDITGRMVYSSAPGNSSSMEISTSGFAPGLYTVVISGGDSVIGKQRVMIQK
jgi:hypothetical protein